MCVISMVHDHFMPLLPTDWQAKPYAPEPSFPWGGLVTGNFTTEEIAAIREVIAAFRKAKAAAEIVDTLTNQPDCVDQEKAKLEQRISVLEARLAELSAKPRKKSDSLKSRLRGA